MSDRRFDLGDYVEVKDRIRIFYELFGQGRLVTTDVRLTSEPDGVPRVLVEAAAYRTPDDPLPGRGWSWMVLPGTTSYTRGSELENTETSAWGRAIAALGILVDKSIATAQEVQNKAEDEMAEVSHADGLIGTVEPGKAPVDMQLRQSPDGNAWGFKLQNGRKAYQVLARGDLADALSVVGDGLTGTRVEVWGSIEMIPWDKGGRAMPPYPRVNLSRIKAPDFTLPAPEAASEPMFALDEDEKAAIAAGAPS